MKRFLEILLNLKPGQLARADDWGPSLLGIPSNSWAVLGILAAAGLMIWLTVRSYLREGQIARRAKLTLAAVRIAVIVGVLLVLAQPALTIKTNRTDYSVAVVLLDDSLSMTLDDNYADLERRAKLVAQLSVDAPTDEAMLANMSRVEIVRRLLGRSGGPVAELAADHPLLVARFAGNENGYTQKLLWIDKTDPADLIRVDPPTESSVTVGTVIAAACGFWLLVLLIWLTVAMLRRRPRVATKKARGPSVFAIVTGVLALLIGLVAGAYAYNANNLRMAAAAEPERVAIEEVPIDKAVGEAVGSLTGGGFETDLVRAIHEIADDVHNRRVAGMILVTDGRSTTASSGPDRLAATRQFAKQRKIPLWTVCVGDWTPQPNIRVASLSIPSLIRRRADVPVKVLLESRGYVDRSVTVKLFRRGEKDTEWIDTGLTAEAPLGGEPDGTDAETTLSKTVVQMNLRCDELDKYVYKAFVDVQPRELFDDDNEAHARVRVTDEKIRVLLVSGDGGWEFQYLRNRLLRNPHKYLVSVWQQNADLDFNQSSSPGMALASLPSHRDDLIGKYDVVILYDPKYLKGDPGQKIGGFDEDFAGLLRDFVGDFRGGLAYIASNKWTSDNICIAEGSDGAFRDLAEVLPVEVGQETGNIAARIGRADRVGWPIRMTAAGAASPIMQLADDGDRNKAAWNLMPGIFWSHPVVRVKPAADVLAHSSDPADRIESVAQPGPLPLIATQIYGRGRSLYMGFDSTWRWRYVQDAYYYDKFWSNVIDYLAAYRLENKRIRLTVPGERFAQGTAVTVKAEVYDAQYKPLGASTYTVRLINTVTKAQHELVLKHDQKQTKDNRVSPLYSAEVKLSEVGEFALTGPNDPDDPEGKNVIGKVITVTLPQEEFIRPEADPEALATLGGADHALGIEEAYDLARRVGDKPRIVTTTTSRDLWSVWLAMVLLCTALLVEWIGRKKYNMA